MSGLLPVATGVGEESLRMDKSLQKENKKMRGEIKQMEMKVKAMQVELTKSIQMKDRLEGLCRELQKQNKYIKAESSAKIQEANVRGKELATEVQNNMGFMQSINENLTAISTESLNVKRENEELAKKIGILRGHYEEREQILQEALKETNDSLHKARIELAEAKVQNATEKEKLIGEMQKLADSLLQSREQVKEAKQTEISLTGMIQSYEAKFSGLQKALKDTNGSYEEFRNEMNKVSSRTKILEKETIKWQQRWEESNDALHKMRLNFTKVQEELVKSQANLEKMKTLCRNLHTENKDLQTELRKQNKGGEGKQPSGLSEAASETLASINLEGLAVVSSKEPSENLPNGSGIDSNPLCESVVAAPTAPTEVMLSTSHETATPQLTTDVDANGNTSTKTESIGLAPPSPSTESSSNPPSPTPGKKNKRKNKSKK